MYDHPQEQFKKCRDCGEEKSLDEYDPDKRARDGHRRFCRDCAGERLKSRRRRAAARTVPSMRVPSVEAKCCPDCGESEPASDFWRSQQSNDGLAFYCKACFGKRNGASYRKRRTGLGKQTRAYRSLPRPPAGMKYCPRCAEIKDVGEFGKNQANKPGLTDYCKPCHNRVMREQRIGRNGSTRNFHLVRRYGVTEAEVDAMIERQGGRCLICRVGAAEHVDHDHRTGAVRGVLCFNCNGGLGQFKDRKDTMARAINHLRGRLPILPAEELVHDDPPIYLTWMDGRREIRLAGDYAHVRAGRARRAR